MQKSIDAFSSNLRKIRTGRATPDILDSVQIDYYGNETPIKQLANVTVEDSQTLESHLGNKNLSQKLSRR
ncbi:MAG: hypothetical protein Ct9H300mP4_15590 [Gammaproteobacteria bacterium]|nr:MAG: hypothetical protein Ct9H300mP4_15590 [Gammaproteobacteria bacterium]